MNSDSSYIPVKATCRWQQISLRNTDYYAGSAHNIWARIHSNSLPRSHLKPLVKRQFNSIMVGESAICRFQSAGS
ncbi:Uncharacterized protein {ECO:0000313/EMBL:CCF11992.1} [Pantoea ananatis]|nr:hypothetical protein B7764_22530 [Pantoea ananatis]CRH31639.1 Uncharacterized protein {ECO:0000313/EMBL:CCF11992.1} [Pantoea ananatis]HCN03620.1 hypothetical protein [Pantoea ananatis]